MDFMITKSFVIWRFWKCGCLSPTSNMQLYYLLACRRRMTHIAFNAINSSQQLFQNTGNPQSIKRLDTAL